MIVVNLLSGSIYLEINEDSFHQFFNWLHAILFRQRSDFRPLLGCLFHSPKVRGVAPILFDFRCYSYDANYHECVFLANKRRMSVNFSLVKNSSMYYRRRMKRRTLVCGIKEFSVSFNPFRSNQLENIQFLVNICALIGFGLRMKKKSIICFAMAFQCSYLSTHFNMRNICTPKQDVRQTRCQSQCFWKWMSTMWRFGFERNSIKSNFETNTCT